MKKIEYFEILEQLDKINYKIEKKIKTQFLLNFNDFQLFSYLDFFLKNKKIELKKIPSEFNQIIQQLLKIRKNQLDLLIVGFDLNINFNYELDSIKKYFDNIRSQISILKDIKKKDPKINIILFNFPNLYTPAALVGKNKGLEKQIFGFNLELEKIAKKENFHIFDYNKIISLVGYDNFYDQKNNYLSKALITEDACFEVSKNLSNIIYSFFEVRKKCLVLDLDNTLWGGVLGEDGISGIKLGNSFEGMKFLNFHKYIKSLSNSGIILAISSKNNFTDVKNFFLKHPDTILQLKDFSVVKANWEPKYKNINEIANELNISMDSIVFFDDSKFEREQMKKFNSEINVIEVPDNVSDFINSIENSSYFYLTRDVTEEDKKKKYQYEINAKAKNLKEKFKENEMDKYLIDLKMKLSISTINQNNFSRCIQMLNKINQFNLTTTRYTESSFKLYLKKNEILSMVCKLEDKFGKHGIIGLLTAKKLENRYVIDNFLLSCRVLGRQVENILIRELFKFSLKKKTYLIDGIYNKTKKNSQCKKFFLNMNFLQTKNNKFRIDLNNFKIKKENLMKIIYEKD